MKKMILLFVLFASTKAIAQQPQYQQTRQRPVPSFRLNAYGGYVFSDHYDYYYSNANYYDGKVNGGFQWGVGLEWMINPYQGIELSYLREDTHAPTTYDDGSIFTGPRTTNFKLAANYIMLGSTRYFKINPIVEPFIGIQVGMGIINVNNPDKDRSATATKFAWGLKGGTNLWVTPRVAIKLQGAFQSVVQGVGGGVYFDPYGVSTGFTTYSSIYQFSLGGGLVFKLGGS